MATFNLSFRVERHQRHRQTDSREIDVRIEIRQEHQGSEFGDIGKNRWKSEGEDCEGIF